MMTHGRELYRHQLGGRRLYRHAADAALAGVLYFLPFNLIQVQHYTPTQAGFAMLPFIAPEPSLGVAEPRVQWFPSEPREPGQRFRASLEALAYLIARGMREHEDAGVVHQRLRHVEHARQHARGQIEHPLHRAGD